MKTIWKSLLLALVMSMSFEAIAQSGKDTLEVNPDPAIKKTAKKVGNKTSEIAAKGAAKVVDKTYKDKVGPQGQTIYIDNKSQYYYVDAKGKKVYVSKAKLKPSGK
ncbi:hypothetical protein [Arcticibacter sp.]|uniref:hypothetical protein n=1 Tax=Arcticibacter sp. TaxID=1872630 RepID=UPI00388D514A